MYVAKPNAVYTCVDSKGLRHNFHAHISDAIDEIKFKASQELNVSIVDVVAEERLTNDDEDVEEAV